MSLKRVINWEHALAVKHALNTLKSDEQAILKSLKDQRNPKPKQAEPKLKLIK